MPRGQAAQEKEIHEQIQIGVNGLHVLTDGPRQGRHVQQAALVMREQHPETAQMLGGDATAELGDVALQIGAYEVLAPPKTGALIPGEEALGEPAPQPEALERLITDLRHVEG